MKGDWEELQEWRLRGKNFLVVVKHYTYGTPLHGFDGGHRWNVHAYIYPKHPVHAKFDQSAGTFQDASADMPLHYGPSLLDWHFDKSGAITSVQVGADYNHLHDNDYTHMSTRAQAADVFADAEELFKWLEDRDEQDKGGA